MQPSYVIDEILHCVTPYVQEPKKISFSDTVIIFEEKTIGQVRNRKQCKEAKKQFKTKDVICLPRRCARRNYVYFPKEKYRISLAIVDLVGKVRLRSDMTTSEVLSKILSTFHITIVGPSDSENNTITIVKIVVFTIVNTIAIVGYQFIVNKRFKYCPWS